MAPIDPSDYEAGQQLTIPGHMSYTLEKLLFERYQSTGNAREYHATWTATRSDDEHVFLKIIKNLAYYSDHYVAKRFVNTSVGRNFYSKLRQWIASGDKQPPSGMVQAIESSFCNRALCYIMIRPLDPATRTESPRKRKLWVDQGGVRKECEIVRTENDIENPTDPVHCELEAHGYDYSRYYERRVCATDKLA